MSVCRRGASRRGASTVLLLAAFIALGFQLGQLAGVAVRSLTEWVASGGVPWLSPADLAG